MAQPFCAPRKVLLPAATGAFEKDIELTAKTDAYFLTFKGPDDTTPMRNITITGISISYEKNPDIPDVETADFTVTAEAETDSIIEGETTAVEAAVEVTSGVETDKTYTWKSSKPSIVSVTGSTAKATVTGIKAGTATLKCYVKMGSVTRQSGEITVTVAEKLAVTSEGQIAGPDTVAVDIPSTLEVRGLVTKGETARDVKWEFADEASRNIIDLDPATGKVTGKAKGTANVKATVTLNGALGQKTEVVLRKQITVKVPAEFDVSVALTDSDGIVAGKTTTATLSVNVTSGEESEKTIVWKSSDESVATVAGTAADSNTATVTGVAEGTAKITCSVTMDGVTKEAEAGVSVAEKLTVSAQGSVKAPEYVKPDDSAILEVTGLKTKGEIEAKRVVTWECADNASKDIIGIEGNGMEATVTGKKPGTATVKATVALEGALGQKETVELEATVMYQNR